MDPASWERVKDVLAEAVKLPPAEREAFVEAQNLPTDLRAKVFEILSSWKDTTPFLKTVPSPIESDVILPTGAIIGPYVISDLIGEGGMGRVYLANDRQLRRRVAMKCLKGPADATIIKEAIAAAQLNHPNVASVFHVIEQGQTLFIVMEYVDGENLAERLKRERLPMLQAVVIGQRLSSALASAHSKGIIHRDLKPGNVQFTRDGTPKVLDFGIANLAQSITVTTGATTAQPTVNLGGPHPGTPPYMSPEQLGGRDLDERSDIYSLGVLLFEMATGRRPFPSSDRAELMELQAGGAPRADSVDAKVPRALADVIARALDTDRLRRPQSALEVEAALDDVARRLRPKVIRELIRLWLARVAIGIPLVVVGLLVLGEFKTLMFNGNYGRIGPFARFGVEPWSALLLWGIAGMGSKLLVMTILTVVVFVARSLFRTLERVGAVGRLTSAVRLSCRNSARALSLDNTMVLAQALAGLGVVLMLVVAWRHQDLMNAWTVSFNSAPIETLLPMRESAFGRFMYHFELTVVTLVMCFGLVAVIARRKAERSNDGRIAVALVASVLAAVILLDDAPFRSFNYRDFERVEYAGLRCYIIGSNGDEFLILCPGSVPPRNRAVRRDDPQLTRQGIIENVFRGIAPGPSAP